MPSGLIESMFLGIIWYNLKTLRKNLQKIFDAIEKIHTFESIILSIEEKEAFAKAAVPLRFENHLQVDINDLLIPHRMEDEHDDLYTVMNIIQENLIRGNVSGTNKDTGRRFTSKEITSIAKDVEVNQGLWDIAERIASIKQPRLALAA